MSTSEALHQTNSASRGVLSVAAADCDRAVAVTEGGRSARDSVLAKSCMELATRRPQCSSYENA